MQQISDLFLKILTSVALIFFKRFFFFAPLVCGHDTAEDATACMELMLWKVKEDGKLKK